MISGNDIGKPIIVSFRDQFVGPDGMCYWAICGICEDANPASQYAIVSGLKFREDSVLFVQSVDPEKVTNYPYEFDEDDEIILLSPVMYNALKTEETEETKAELRVIKNKDNDED